MPRRRSPKTLASDEVHEKIKSWKSSQVKEKRDIGVNRLLKLGRPLIAEGFHKVTESRLSTLGHQKRRESSSWISADTSAKKVLLCDLCAIFYRCFDS